MREDKSSGVKQEVLLKIFLDKRPIYKEEFESLSQTFSPYCVRLFGFESFGDKKALVLEYIKGASLLRVMSHFFLKPEEIQYILFSIYKGLEDLSRQGLCHGDLSLDNVLIDEKAHIKLIDFGKANYERDVQGTPPFTAPETLKGARSNFLSDLYSLGVIEALLKTSGPLSSLKDMRAEDFAGDSPLLSSDPLKRFFPYKTSHQAPDPAVLKSLSYKARDILSFIESKRCPTLKTSPPKIRPRLKLARQAFLFCVLAMAGMASFQPHGPAYGWISAYTNEWFILRVGGMESYTPLTLPLKAGWRSIQWTSQKAQGETKVFVSNGKPLFLNDESFLIKKDIP